jgi:hypothetical protein
MNVYQDLRKRAAQGKSSTPRPGTGTCCEQHMGAESERIAWFLLVGGRVVAACVLVFTHCCASSATTMAVVKGSQG